MKRKKSSNGCLGNITDSVLSGPIKKKKHTEELPSSLDSLDHFVEQEIPKDILIKRKNKK